MSVNLFRSIPLRKPKRNYFDLSHEVDMTGQMGILYPILCEPVVPRDKAKLRTEIFVRMQPMLAPIIARVNVYTHFFFVPNRLIWDKWEDFITKGASGTDAPVYPTVTQSIDATQIVEHFDPANGALINGSRSLADYLDFQPFYSDSTSSPVNNTWQNQNHQFYDALPFRAYHLICDEYYRDQNLQQPWCWNIYEKDGSAVPVSSEGNLIRFGSGTSSFSLSLSDFGHPSVFCLRRRAWEKDYFTSALPWPQRGQDVSIPFGSGSNPLAPVVFNNNRSGGVLHVSSNSSGSAVAIGSGLTFGGADVGSKSSAPFTAKDGNNYRLLSYDPNGTLDADMTNIVGATINDLRRSIKLQEFYEKDARGGSRYIEKILSHFGVRSSDARLQRPEYLGGGISPIVISDVVQQSESTSSSPLGQYAGHGVSAQVTHQFKRSFEEHGFIVGILSIMPKATYMNGTPRKYLKRDFFDFYWPEFANLGEQPIYAQELYTNTQITNLPTDDNANNTIFGYTPRYAEYKFIHGKVKGDFRDSLSYWHLGRNFVSAPTLSDTFVYEKPSDRIWPVQDQSADPFLIQIYHNFHMMRPMPKFGVPII